MRINHLLNRPGKETHQGSHSRGYSEMTSATRTAKIAKEIRDGFESRLDYSFTGEVAIWMHLH